MQEPPFDPLAPTDDEGKCAVGPGEATGAAEKSIPEGGEFLEDPQGGALGSGGATRFGGGHLQFPGQVVGEQRGQQIELVPDPRADGDMAHLTLRLQFAEDSLLRPASFMKRHHRLDRLDFVGDDLLELMAVFVRNELVKLNRNLVLPFRAGADQDKAKAFVPGLGFPGGLEE